MEDYFEGTLDDVVLWELLDGTDTPDTVHKANENTPAPKTVFTLRRDSVALYGVYPKMEQRVFSSCGICEQVFNPHAVSAHKEHCPGKGRPSQLPRKNPKSKKKPPPPLFKKESPGPPVLSKYLDIPPPSAASDVPPSKPILLYSGNNGPPCLPDPLENPNRDEHASRHRRPKKATRPEPPPPEAPPPPPVEAVAGPNHKFQESPGPPVLSKYSDIPRSQSPRLAPVGVPLWKVTNQIGGGNSSTSYRREPPEDEHSTRHRKPKKAAPPPPAVEAVKDKVRKSASRSKNAEKKIVKDKESRRHPETKPPELVFPLIELNPIDCGTEAPAKFTKLAPDDLPKNDLHDEVESDDPSLESGYCSIEPPLSTKSSPVLYFNPISPIFVVTPVQFIQKENSVFVEAPSRVTSPPPNGYFLALPEPTAKIKFYKSHPKPAILPTYGARKVGGAILSSNQRVEYQRNDIQMAITTRRMASSSSNCKATSFSVPPQRSIILKTKGITKANHKRPPSDIISGVSDSKQIKLSDVNGFILHTEMSEVAETPQPNHCIQENINLLNMK